MGPGLYTEGEAASGIPVDELVRHFRAHFGNKSATRAVHRDHDIGRERLQFGDRVLDVIRWCNAQMEAAEHRMQLVDPRDRHRGSDRVQHAAMTAGGDDDKATPLHDIASGMLVGSRRQCAPPSRARGGIFGAQDRPRFDKFSRAISAN